jgi:uncharacterized protein involved in exopolysaccharide biosynthesis
MTESTWQDRDTISIFSMGLALLRARWRIARWMLLGAALAAAYALSRPREYGASASFVPQGADPGRSGLASLAGQFGLQLPATSSNQSPDFYVAMLESRVLLAPIVHDTFAVAELGGRRVPFLELFEIADGSDAWREEQGVKRLQEAVSASVNKTTGVVGYSVRTTWRSVSLAIASALLEGVNDYNQRVRQGQATAERKFVEGRLAVATAELRRAESRLEQFLSTNRQIGGSPGLATERDRIQRELTLRQQIYNSLMASYEEVRIREVRDTPVITVFEPPSAPTRPASRGGVKLVLGGLLGGGFLGALLVFLSVALARRRADGDAEADEFLTALGEVKQGMGGRLRRLAGRSGR